METFEEAQKLFKDYQKNGKLHNLRDSLDILDDIIERQDLDSQRALNLKNTILKFIDNQIKEIMVRCNVLEFGKDLKDCAEQDILIDKFATILSASVIKENGERFIELITTKSDYFKKKTN